MYIAGITNSAKTKYSKLDKDTISNLNVVRNNILTTSLTGYST